MKKSKKLKLQFIFNDDFAAQADSVEKIVSFVRAAYDGQMGHWHTLTLLGPECRISNAKVSKRGGRK